MILEAEARKAAKYRDISLRVRRRSLALADEPLCGCTHVKGLENSLQAFATCAKCFSITYCCTAVVAHVLFIFDANL